MPGSSGGSSRKIGREKRKASHMGYNSRNQRVKNKLRKVRKLVRRFPNYWAIVNVGTRSVPDMKKIQKTA